MGPVFQVWLGLADHAAPVHRSWIHSRRFGTGSSERLSTANRMMLLLVNFGECKLNQINVYMIYIFNILYMDE